MENVTLESVLKVYERIENTSSNEEIMNFSQLSNTDEYGLLQDLVHENGSREDDIRLPEKKDVIDYFSDED